MSGKSASLGRLPDSVALAGWLPRYERRLRILLLLGGALGLIAGLCGGLWRLGWILPHGAPLAALHGPLMISGLFGTLISLERAVALGGGWPYFSPALAALGSVLLLAGAPPAYGAGAYVLAGGLLAAASLQIVRKQPALFTGTLLLGAMAWTTGNIVWLAGGSFVDAAGWWLAFLVLTIAGERLEMSRFLGPRRGSHLLFVVAAALLAAGAAAGITKPAGAVPFGLGLLVTMVWLLRHDIAQRTVRLPGQARFFAVCMLAGYPWLGIAGSFLLLPGLPYGADILTYDIAVHAVTIGFVLSMVFGHALIILPAVTGLTLRYSPILYAPLAILHVSMFARLSGALADLPVLRMASGPLTIIAIVAFAACVAVARTRIFNPIRAEAVRPFPAEERISP